MVSFKPILDVGVQGRDHNEKKKKLFRVNDICCLNELNKINCIIVFAFFYLSKYSFKWQIRFVCILTTQQVKVFDAPKLYQSLNKTDTPSTLCKWWVPCLMTTALQKTNDRVMTHVCSDLCLSVLKSWRKCQRTCPHLSIILCDIKC